MEHRGTTQKAETKKFRCPHCGGKHVATYATGSASAVGITSLVTAGWFATCPKVGQFRVAFREAK